MIHIYETHARIEFHLYHIFRKTFLKKKRFKRFKPIKREKNFIPAGNTKKEFPNIFSLSLSLVFSSIHIAECGVM